MSLAKKIYEKKDLRDLEIELRSLVKILRFKSNPFCRRKLETLIKNYFGEK